MNNIECERTEAIYDLKGNSKLPANNVIIKDIKVGEVTQFIGNIENVQNVISEDIFVNGNKIDVL